MAGVGDEKRLGPMRWGFVPTAAKDPKLAPINARAETLATSPMFRDALRRHRCLVAADEFYEWRKDGRRKTPFFTRLRSRDEFDRDELLTIRPLSRFRTAASGRSAA
jgi:putative SOS response-associated peptidase YedK